MPDPNIPLACQALRAEDYKYDSFDAALRELKLKKGESPRGPTLADRGPCVEVGWHWTIPRRGGKVESITSCPCVDGPNRPVRTLFKIH